eukprot:901295-Pelagomonas_calceolata.AAC.2
MPSTIQTKGQAPSSKRYAKSSWGSVRLPCLQPKPIVKILCLRHQITKGSKPGIAGAEDLLHFPERHRIPDGELRRASSNTLLNLLVILLSYQAAKDRSSGLRNLKFSPKLGRVG